MEEQQPSGQRREGRSPSEHHGGLRSYFREVANLSARLVLHDPCADCRVLNVRAQNELLYLISSARRDESQRDAGLDHPQGGRSALPCGSSLQAADMAESAMTLCHRGCWMVWMADFECVSCSISAMIRVHRLDLGPASTSAAQRVTGVTVLTRG